MSHHPMGAGGADVDIVDGQPLVSMERTTQRIQAAETKLEQATLESAELAEELRANPHFLQTLAKQYLQLLDVLADQNLGCQAIEAVFKDLNIKLEIIPYLRRQQVRNVMGPLQQFFKDEQ